MNEDQTMFMKKILFTLPTLSLLALTLFVAGNNFSAEISLTPTKLHAETVSPSDDGAKGDDLGVKLSGSVSETTGLEARDLGFKSGGGQDDDPFWDRFKEENWTLTNIHSNAPYGEQEQFVKVARNQEFAIDWSIANVSLGNIELPEIPHRLRGVQYDGFIEREEYWDLGSKGGSSQITIDKPPEVTILKTDPIFGSWVPEGLDSYGHGRNQKWYIERLTNYELDTWNRQSANSEPGSTEPGIGRINIDVVQCEKGIYDVLNKLSEVRSLVDTGIFRQVNITENDFRSWSSNNEDAIKNEILEAQCLLFDHSVYVDFLANLQSYLDLKEFDGLPAPFFYTIYKIEDGEVVHRGGHVVILLDIEFIEGEMGEPIDGVAGGIISRPIKPDFYRVKVLDPSGPDGVRIITDECRFGGHTLFPGGISCPNLYSPDTVVVPTINLQYKADSHAKRVNSYILRCQEEIDKFGDYRSESCNRGNLPDRTGLSEWLENNHTHISNKGEWVGRGVCFGWVDFVLSVTYRGNFVGECPGQKNNEEDEE